MFLKSAQKSIFKKKLVTFLIILSALFIVGSFVPLKIHALLMCSSGDVGAQCNNGPNANDSGGCGNPCGQGTDPWTKYQCQYSPGTCGWLGYCYVKLGPVCSTGDKCVPGETGLRPGYCDCGTSGPIYKTCCSGSTPVACNIYGVQDNYPPPEGTCAPNTYVYGTSCPSSTPAPGPTSAPAPGPTSAPAPTPTSAPAPSGGIIMCQLIKPFHFIRNGFQQFQQGISSVFSSLIHLKSLKSEAFANWKIK